MGWAVLCARPHDPHRDGARALGTLPARLLESPADGNLGAMRPLICAAVLLCAAACKHPPPGSTTPAHSPKERVPPPPSAAVRDTALEQRAGRLELKTLEQEAEIEELQHRLDDARREVVRAMAKLQSLATRAEAASGMAEAEIALQALRSANGSSSSLTPEISQASQLLQLATAEFDKQNYGGALYLATQAKNAAATGQGRLASSDRGKPRAGEVP